MTQHKIINPYILIAMYFFCVFFPIAVYVYIKKIKRGLIVTTLSEVTILGVIAIILTYNYSFEQLLLLVGVQVSAFVFVIYDCVFLLRKKERMRLE